MLNIRIQLPIQYDYELPDGTQGSGSISVTLDPKSELTAYEQIESALRIGGGFLPEGLEKDTVFEASINKREGALERANAVPGWATISDDQALAFFDTNIAAPLGKTNPTNADILGAVRKMAEAQRKMIQMILAIRDRAFSELGSE